MQTKAQQFFNLTAAEVTTDSVAPQFCHTSPLPANYRDSVYTVSIAYPEFIDMPASDVARYQRLYSALPPALPEVATNITFNRKQPFLSTSFCPVVFREGKYQLLVSFLLKQEAVAKGSAKNFAQQRKADVAPAERYAAHSVLASGKWAKIRVATSGFHQITESLIRQAGFTDIDKVKVFGYGGNLKNEILTADDLIAGDDLKEVATYKTGNRRVFYARGPVSWDSNTAMARTRNPYSDYGYYFLTEQDDAPVTISADSMKTAFYPTPNDFHSHYEVDGYAWYNGGRNLFDSRSVEVGSSQTVNIAAPNTEGAQLLVVCVSAGGTTRVQVEMNDSVVGTIKTTLSDSRYVFGCSNSQFFIINNIKAENTVKLTVLEGSTMRLDYITLLSQYAKPMADLDSESLPTPQYVYGITNQDHHADPQADLVIIIPTSQKLLAQAQRLKAFHEERDSMRVSIVPADELYNEFSSGTPDASAYRHYMKMLYDRAADESDIPKYLLLFGDCVWDNRMLTSSCSSLDPDDYLLAFESEDSFDKRSCYIDDGFYAMLDDGEGAKPLWVDKLDVAVGRFPVTTEQQAKTMVDKTIAYAENENGGAWQNTIFFMGDDGDSNQHMEDANIVAEQVISSYPNYLVKKVMWDAYPRETSSTGHTYPDVTRLIKQQQQAGALVMDYAGHGSEIQLSHETVLRITDFENFSNTNLPLWVTASCDIMPFDGVDATIGETAVLNSKGGAVAFYGTTRTVYASQNTTLNKNFMRYVLSYNDDGTPCTLGEAQRLAKNASGSESLARNTLQYSLLGDPALALHLPTAKAVVDEINGVATGSGADITLKAGSRTTVKGHIEGHDDFNGIVTLTVRDNRELVTCRLNDNTAAETAFTYYDRPNTLYNGNDSVRAGRFEMTFTVPKDINYSNLTGIMNLYAINSSHTVIASGSDESFTVGGSDIADNDSIGPSIYCYLNSPSFQNGGEVNATPYFVAQIMDKDGINATGNGIGHDLQLIIDGNPTYSYSLNDNFSFDFGSYTSGTTYYNIPELSAGKHKLAFRAWDVLNNVSIAELTFNVVHGIKPQCSVECTKNPATVNTTFIVSHDRSGSELTVGIDVFDMSGRQLWRHEETGTSAGSAYTVDWDLTLDSGQKLETGVYLYRVRLTSEGATRTSKAKKLIVFGNK